MRLYTLLLLIPIVVLSEQKKKDCGRGCKRAKGFEDMFSGFVCSTDVGIFDSSPSFEKMLENPFKGKGLNMTPWPPLTEQACAASRHLKFPEDSCDHKVFEHHYGSSPAERSHQLHKLAENIGKALKELAQPTGNIIHARFGCYPMFPNKVVCVTSFDPIPKRNKDKTRQQDPDKKKNPGEGASRHRDSTEGKDSIPPAVPLNDRRSSQHSPPASSGQRESLEKRTPGGRSDEEAQSGRSLSDDSREKEETLKSPSDVLTQNGETLNNVSVMSIEEGPTRLELPQMGETSRQDSDAEGETGSQLSTSGEELGGTPVEV